MINIQKSCSVHIGLILSSSVHFGSLGFILVLFSSFSLYWSFSVHYVHFSPLQPYSDHSVCLVLFGPFYSILLYLAHLMVLFSPFYPLRSYSANIGSVQSTFILFNPIWSYSFYYVHFGPNLSIHSYSVLFGPLWSYTVHISPLSLFLSYTVHFVLFSPIRSNSVHLVSIRSYSVHFIPHLVQLDPFVSTLIQFSPFLYTYI